MSNAGKRHMGRVADYGRENGCVVCGAPYAHIHHMVEGRTPGLRSDDFLTMPLCEACHVGTHGVHGTKQRLSLHRVSETQALAKTLEALYGGK